MDWGLVLFGGLLVGIGGYSLLNFDAELERDLRWRGFDTDAIDPADHPRMRERSRKHVWALVAVGLVCIGGGVVEMAPDTVAVLVVLVALLGATLVLATTA